MRWRSAFCGLPKLQLFGSRFCYCSAGREQIFFETADPFRRTALSISYSRQRSHGTQKSTFVKALETCRAILIQVFGSCLIQSRSPIYLGFRLNEPDPCGAVEIALCFCPYLYRHKTPSCPPGHGHARSESSPDIRGQHPPCQRSRSLTCPV